MNYFTDIIDKTNLKNLALRSSRATVFSRILCQLIQTIGTIILARILVPIDFGLVAMVLVFSAILIEFGTLRLGDATIQRENINHGQISALFWTNFAICTFLSIVLSLLSSFISDFYNEPRLELIAAVLSISYIFSGLSIQHIALLQRTMQFDKFAKIQIYSTLLSTVLSIVFALIGYGYWSIVFRHISLTFFVTVFAWNYCRWVPGRPTIDSQVKEMYVFGINSLGNYFTGYIVRSIDKFLLGYKFDANHLGNYDRAYHLFVLPVNQLSYPFTSVAVATLSRLKNDPILYKQYFIKAFSFLAFFGMYITTLGFIIGDDFIILLLGNDWQFAGRIFTIFSTGIGMMLLYGTNGWLHLSLGRADRFFRWGVFSSIATVLLFIASISYGAIGISTAYSLSFYILLIPCIYYAGKPIELGIWQIINAFYRHVISAFLSCLICWYVLNYSQMFSDAYHGSLIIIRMIIAVILCTIFYSIFTVILYRGLLPFRQSYKIIMRLINIKR